MFDLDKLVSFIIKTAQIWGESISNPKQFLTPSFLPRDEQIFNGVEFYLTIFLVCFLFNLPFAFTQKGEFQHKVRFAASAVLGLITTGFITMVWHFPFWLVGGESNFGGTFLAYVYTMSPYLLIMTLCGLIVLAGVPSKFRPYALNPATQQQAFKHAMEDPNASRTMVGIFGVVTIIILFWSLVVLTRCLGFVHNLHGWKFTGVIFMSIVLLIPTGLVVRKVTTIISPIPEPDAAGTPP